jgi:anti-sigma B factor antagonist
VAEDEGADLTVSVERDGAGDVPGAVVLVAGELDIGTAAPLRDALLDLGDRGATPIVVDLAGVDFIDSSGVSLLVEAKQRADAAGKELVLRQPTPRVMRVLEVTGLVDLFVVE